MGFSNYGFYFEEETRKLRRNLLLVCFPPYCIELFDIKITKITFLGIELQNADMNFFRFGFAIPIFYLTVTFLWNFIDEFIYWRTETLRTTLASNNKLDVYLRISSNVKISLGTDTKDLYVLDSDKEKFKSEISILISTLKSYLNRYNTLSASLKIKLWLWDIALPVILALICELALWKVVDLSSYNPLITP